MIVPAYVYCKIRFETMKSGIFAVLCLVLLNACAAPKLDQNFIYSAASPNAMIAVRDYRIKKGATVTIRKVNMATGELFGRALILGDNKTTSTPAFHMKELPPGVYSIVAITTTSQVGFRRYVNHKCYSPILEVFEISAGKINAVKVGKLRPGTSLPEPELDKILSTFAGITAPVRQAKLLGYLDVKGRECRSKMREDIKVKVLKISMGTAA